MGFTMRCLLWAHTVLAGGWDHWSNGGHHEPLQPARAQNTSLAPAEPNGAEREGRKVRGQVAGKAKQED